MATNFVRGPGHTVAPPRPAPPAVVVEHAEIGADADGLVVSWSAGAQRIHGYPAEQVVGTMHLVELFGPSPDGQQTVAGLCGMAASPAVWVGRLPCRHASGTWFTTDVVAIPRSCDASPAGVLLVCRPVPVGAVTVAEPADEFRPPQAWGAEMFSKLGHELRSPLAGVIGLTRVMSSRVAAGRVDPAQQLRQFGMIQASADRLLATVERVVDISRIASGQIVADPCIIDGRDAVEDVLADCRQDAEERGLRLHLDVPDHPVTLTTDPTMLSRILRELVGNAVKFAGTGDICARITGGDGQPVKIDISDGGPGILTEELTRIFDAFERGELAAAIDDDGAGLGLCVVRGLAGLLHIEIGVRSRIGWGSTFTLTFPDNGSPVQFSRAVQSRS